MVTDRQYIQKIILQAMLSLGLFFLVFSLLQNTWIYENTLGQVSHNYRTYGHEKVHVKEPFQEVSTESMIRWDAAGYYRMKNSLYAHSEEEKAIYNNFAFFPLFPLLWKVTHLSVLGMSVFNFLMFLVGFILLYRSYLHIFPEGDLGRAAAVLIFLPTNLVFFIPYSEATFFLSCSLGLYGIVKKSWFPTVLGLLLCAMARPITPIIIPLFAVAEVFHRLRYGWDWKGVLQNILKLYVPSVVGVGIVMLIQKYYGSPHLFYFMESQEKFWGLFLSWPGAITDWSKEGYVMNFATFLLAVIPAFLFLARRFILLFGKKEPEGNRFDPKWDFIVVLSALYIVAMFVVTLFYRHGSINTLFRYVLCTPFFFVFAFHILHKLRGSSLRLWIQWSVVGYTALGIFLIRSVPYTYELGFKWLGFVLLFFAAFLLLPDSRKVWVQILFCVFALGSAVWQAYLFNAFLSDGWIFL